MAEALNQKKQEDQKSLDTNPNFIGTDVDWVPAVKKSIRLRQMDEFHQLAEDLRASAAVHSLAKLQRAAYGKKIGLTSEEAAGSEVEPEDMRLGDDDNSLRIENFYASGQPAQQQNGQPTRGDAGAVAKKEPTALNKWAPVIGAALLGSGLAGGIGLTKLLTKPSDTNTQYRIDGDFEPAQDK